MHFGIFVAKLPHTLAYEIINNKKLFYLNTSQVLKN